MGRKIFVSYKYADDRIQNLKNAVNSTVRDYVDEFISNVNSTDDIYKGEHDGEDLSDLDDNTIWEKLKDKIYDSSVTILFISPGMKEKNKEDRDQWIPWEISYSLKETSRRDKNGNSVTSHTNAMIAVVLPDENGSYSYYLEKKSCCNGGCRIHHTDKLFRIVRKNKFNRVKNSDKSVCHANNTIWKGTCSYIEAVKWSDFINDYSKYIDLAVDRQSHLDEYDIEKEI